MIKQNNNKNKEKELYVINHEYHEYFVPNGCIANIIQRENYGPNESCIINVNNFGQFPILNKYLVPIDDISDLVINKYNVKMTKKDVKTIFDIGLYLSKAVNKSLEKKDEDRVFIYTTLLDPTPTHLYHNIIEKYGQNDRLSFIIFGTVDNSSLDKIISFLSAYINIESFRMESHNLSWGEAKFNYCTSGYAMSEMVVALHGKHKANLLVKNKIIEDLNYDLDGNSDHVEIRSMLRTTEKQIDILKNKIQKLYDIQDCFISIEQMKKMLVFDKEYSEFMSDLSINGGIYKEKPIEYKYANLTGGIRINKKIQQVNSLSIKDLTEMSKTMSKSEILNKCITLDGDQLNNEDYIEEAENSVLKHKKTDLSKYINMLGRDRVVPKDRPLITSVDWTTQSIGYYMEDTGDGLKDKITKEEYELNNYVANMSRITNPGGNGNK